MTKDTFFALLTSEVQTYKDYLETENHDWIVKGFIDIDKNVYTITNDTKVVSKIIEILLVEIFLTFLTVNCKSIKRVHF